VLHAFARNNEVKRTWFEGKAFRISGGEIDFRPDSLSSVSGDIDRSFGEIERRDGGGRKSLSERQREVAATASDFEDTLVI
jgi:hypothetical protein